MSGDNEIPWANPEKNAGSTVQWDNSLKLTLL